jgi:hypothetical protein
MTNMILPNICHSNKSNSLKINENIKYQINTGNIFIIIFIFLKYTNSILANLLLYLKNFKSPSLDELLKRIIKKTSYEVVVVRTGFEPVCNPCE